MKILILNTDYSDFLLWLYSQHPGLDKKIYKTQLNTFNESLFGVSDFYSRNLCQLGHDAIDIHFNNINLQEAWLNEKGLTIPNSSHWQFNLYRGIIPLFSRSNRKRLYDILKCQLEYYQPDIVLNQAMDGINNSFFRKNKSNMGLLVGQHAAMPLPENEDYSCYDLVISSFPPTINFFRSKGISSELHRLAFEPKILSSLENCTKKYDVTFIGSFAPVHKTRVDWLEYLVKEFPQIKIWSSDIHHLSKKSPIHKCYVGPAWGRQMYQIFCDSKITLNHHGNIPPYANNLRLYEATGVGTCLITDWKKNIYDIFEDRKEIISYKTPEECNKFIRYYLENDEERKKIALAGQKRTLTNHNYIIRMQEFLEIISKYTKNAV
jgi:spore maturation protein CgeB